MIATRQFSGLILDFEGVLCDASALYRWLFQEVQRLGVFSHFNLFYRLWRDEFYPQVCCGARPLWSVLGNYLTQMGFGQAQADEICLGLRSKFGDPFASRPLPTVAPTLQRLIQKRIPIGFLARTSIGHNELCRRIAAMGVHADFPWVRTTTDLCQPRIDKSDFRNGCQAMGLDPVWVAYVSTDTDLLSVAQLAGLQPIQIEGESSRFSVIHRLDALLQWCGHSEPLLRAG